MNGIATLILFALHMLLQTVAGCIMLAKHRQQNDRSRLFIAISFLTSAVATVGAVAAELWHPNYADGLLLLDPMIIFAGFVIFFLLLLYPVEMLRPNWLNAKRTVIMLLPWLIPTVILAVWWSQFSIRPLHTLDEVVRYIGEPNVWLRVLLMFIYVPYGIWLLVMEHNWRNSSAPLPWLHAVVLVTLCMTVTFFCGCGLRLHGVQIVHMVLYMVLTGLILYLELAVRMRVPDDKVNDTYTSPVVEPDMPIVNETDQPQEETSETIKEVANRITEAMQNLDVWQNPDLTQADLIRLAGTNRRYCQLAIKHLGYDSYPDMINRRRVAYIQQQLRSDPRQNLQKLFYAAGYRSRTSAWRNFTAITGCSPTDFSVTKQDEQVLG